MTCGDVSKFILAYLDHDFSAETEQEWHQHLESCSVCRDNV
jgi:predicted anti-sigma-YlaC factor YlaD